MAGEREVLLTGQEKETEVVSSLRKVLCRSYGDRTQWKEKKKQADEEVRILESGQVRLCIVVGRFRLLGAKV